MPCCRRSTGCAASRPRRSRRSRRSSAASPHAPALVGGRDHGDLLPVQAWHGPRAAEDLWYAVTRHDHGRAEAVFPDVSRFLQSDSARTARFAETFSRTDAVRAILPAGAMTDPEIAACVTRFAASRVEFRLLAAPPSWFWIDDETVALPFRWGEGWPSRVLGVRSPALTELARAYFEALWRDAQPSATMPQWA